MLPGEKASVFIDVMASESLLSKNLILGLTVDMPNMPSPHFSTLQIKAKPYWMLVSSTGGDL